MTEPQDMILKKAIPSDVNSFVLRKEILPRLPSLFFVRHHITPTKPLAFESFETSASHSNFIKIAPRPSNLDPDVVTLPKDNEGVSRAAILKRNYRSKAGVREREREREIQRRKKKAKIVDNSEVCFESGSPLATRPNNLSITGILHTQELLTQVFVKDVYMQFKPGKVHITNGDKILYIKDDNKICELSTLLRDKSTMTARKNVNTNSQKSSFDSYDETESSDDRDVQLSDNNELVPCASECGREPLLRRNRSAHVCENCHSPMHAFCVYKKGGSLAGEECEGYGAGGLCRPCSFIV